ncbi:hypothetical protein MKW98_009326 [Papaver atlanticum]|uniref:Uncharacterized protein n=1 Tax=Papaver atlanticum TaxID=357466 RepID=A0AAD4X649_9MAGN|nr:hypothetical protein MKW98_009326 [Papaver atlanticum]
MVVVTSTTSSSSSLLQSKLHHQTVNSRIQANLNYYSTTKSKPTLLHFHLIYKNHSDPSSCRVRNSSNTNGVLSVKSYMENPNTISGIAGRILGSLPIIGLAARILIDEGGVGGDIIDFAEFRRRAGKKCSIVDSRAFYEFQDRRGKVGNPIYVLHCCWLAAVGAGLLKSEEILEGVARLSLSDDIEFEEETFVAIMNEARERRAKMKIQNPAIPMVDRAEKALEAIYVCCFAGRDPIEEDDERLLRVILNCVFPSVGQPEIDRIVREKAKRVAEGEEINYKEPKFLTKDAVQQQMKDLKFLQQNNEQ